MPSTGSDSHARRAARMSFPVRLAAYLVPAAAGTLVVTALGFWVSIRAPGAAHFEAWSRMAEQLRAEYLGAGGARRFLADLLCILPWSLAAFTRSGRLATFAAAPRSLDRVLRILGLTLAGSLIGHAVRVPWDGSAQPVRMVLACTVALAPPYVVFAAAMLVLARLPGRALTAWAAIPVCVLVARWLLPDLFDGQPVVDAAGQVRIFPPTPEERVALLAPLLGLWGLFTLIELRIEAAARRRDPGCAGGRSSTGSTDAPTD